VFTAIITAVIVSAFWIWFYNFVPSQPAAVGRSGNVVTVKPGQAPPVAVAEQVEVAPSGLAIPVVGVKPDQLTDTYDQARGQGRRHDALDIMAPEGTPVIAAADGKVEKLFNSVRGGTTIYVRAPDQKPEGNAAPVVASGPDPRLVSRAESLAERLESLADALERDATNP
jgi:hypothetical protein